MQKCKLDEVLVPYLPEYFHPVNKKMTNLLSESLRINEQNRFDSSKPFYENNEISVRLLKEYNQQNYVLVVQNKCVRKISIAYTHHLQSKFGD